MNNKSKIALASIIVVAAVFLAVAFSIYQKSPGNESGNGTTNDETNITSDTNQSSSSNGEKLKTVVNIASSPSAFPFVEKWIAQYNNEEHLAIAKVHYSDDLDEATGTPTYSNVSDFLSSHSADLAITENIHFPISNFTNSTALYLPVSPQAIVIVYNVPAFPDIASGLKLDPLTLSSILSGNITSWSDEKIGALNPGMNLPSEGITIVHEAGTGTASDLLGRYLYSDTNYTMNWPEGSIASESADDLATTVRQTPFSLGYVDFSYAVQTKMTYASLQNSDGEYVLPSLDSIDKGIQNGTVSANQSSSILFPERTIGHSGNGSYPVVGFYYAVFDNEEQLVNGSLNDTSVSDKQAALKAEAMNDLVKWIVYGPGQKQLNDLQYPSVYAHSEALKNYLNATIP
jgi:phosphate transport system substrate-binding protein